MKSSETFFLKYPALEDHIEVSFFCNVDFRCKIFDSVEVDIYSERFLGHAVYVALQISS